MTLLVEECTLKQLGRTTDGKDHQRMLLPAMSALLASLRAGINTRKLILHIFSPWPGSLRLCLFEPLT